MNENRQFYLSVVPHDNFDTGHESAQLPLFPDKSNRLFFLTVSRSTHHGFAKFIEELRPRWVLDFRPVPWFNFGNYSRKSIFILFEKNKVAYQDVYSNLKLKGRNDARIVSGQITDLLNKLLPAGYKGPIVCLWDDPEIMGLAAEIIPEKLRILTKQDWKATITDPEDLSTQISSQSSQSSQSKKNRKNRKDPPTLQTVIMKNGVRHHHLSHKIRKKNRPG
jgi:hypothetical protein